jgi:NAD(P)-dependent dehydrogenase (short-subunit alcohol dehydrogenase family)
MTKPLNQQQTDEFRGKVAIITGGGSGIGAATAHLFASQGVKVVIANRSTKTGEAVVNEIQQKDGEARFIATDVSNPQQVAALVEQTVQAYGKVDILFNNAGVANVQPFWEIEEDAWEKTIQINLNGQFYCAKYAAPHMIARKQGAIINMSSVLAYATNPGLTAYSATKTGIIGLTRAMALDLAPFGVRVNCIVPGSIDTPMMWDGYDEEALPEIRRIAAESVPVGRVAQPEEIATAVVFLASSAASLVNGTSLVADGALLAKIATDY